MRLRNRAILAGLRSATALSQALSGGRAIGLACVFAAKLMSKDDWLKFDLGGGGTFGVPRNDRYWLHYLLLERQYEPDLDHFLSRMMTGGDSFLDCGANLGLWSVVASQVIDDPRRVVAIEAGKRTFSRLKRNWETNGKSFSVINKAVGLRSGDSVTFYSSESDHASATMKAELSPQDAKVELIETISVGELTDQQAEFRTSDDQLIFVKLDIEGMEREIFASIEPGKFGNVIFLFEDHGNVRDHISIDALERGFQVAFLADDGSIEVIIQENIGRLDLLKTNPARGYNLIALSPNGMAERRITRCFGPILQGK
ncbi:FkbM family methyltransferase [Qipengyuania sphaerica]|uniref:FkbM family methyltransferase n=1 Tax=Qipengyuania sphaerica TaxID=2867243 RepID=UPI001C86D774|nr:FkbM family methyltransferase [Qipengyuania sphaerica]MBX7539403.1 FkbM family methyltransferase [Qipengyuania sphaerica]